MEYAEGLQKAIDYIERHLDDEISVSEIAAQANFSPFYFQRIFGLLCGMTLGEYIRSRRLARAGSELKTADCKVIDVALKYGYDSPESFSRAFTKFHGVTPSEAKKDGCTLRSFSPLSVNLTLTGGTIMNYKITEKDAFYVLEKLSRHTALNGENNLSIPAFWDECHSNGCIDTLIQSASDAENIFGICYAQKPNENAFEYSIAVICDENTSVPQGYRKNLIPARNWAVFECIGAMPDAIQETWRKIVSEFFPASGYRPTCEMDIEAYPDGDTDSADYRSEIWVPIEKK